MALSYLWTSRSSIPHGIRIAVVAANAQAGQQATALLRRSAAGALAPVATVDVAHARAAINDRSVEAAFPVGPATTDELMVATAAAPNQSARLAARFQAFERAANAP